MHSVSVFARAPRWRASRTTSRVLMILLPRIRRQDAIQSSLAGVLSSLAQRIASNPIAGDEIPHVLRRLLAAMQERSSLQSEDSPIWGGLPLVPRLVTFRNSPTSHAELYTTREEPGP